jgi:peptidoglycan/xylan/chitin deacetylase (PgdA/CDA1 family)
MAVTLPHRWFFVRAPAGSNAITLTFDDGPHPDYTPRLLDELKEQRVAATFFVIGKLAERYPDLVRRMAAEGHAVGNHSFDHVQPHGTSAEQLVAEMKRTRDLLASLIGEAPTLFRPPYGRVTFWKLLHLWWAGQTVVLWNVDPKDYTCQTAEEVRAWFADRPLQGGDVVMMHDNLPHAAQVLPHLVELARARGMGFTTVSHWTT